MVARRKIKLSGRSRLLLMRGRYDGMARMIRAAQVMRELDH
jgi:hypothetical protein